MKVKELTVTAVIPTAQYANLQPSVTVEVDGDYDEAKKEAMKHIAQFSSQYAEDGKALAGGTTVKKLRKLTPFIGDTDIFFDREAHAYCDEEGNVYESGSAFAKKYEYEFNADMIAVPYAKKFGVTEDEVKKFWRAKGESSTTFGTALHQALETQGKFSALASKLSTADKTVETGIHPTLLPIVQAFFTDDRLKENAVYEPFVSHQGLRRCGQIDRFVIVDGAKRTCKIEDYKTNADLEKQNSPKTLKEPFKNVPNTPLGGYTLQLNHYRTTVEANGWTVIGMFIHHWNGVEWKEVEVNKVEI